MSFALIKRTDFSPRPGILIGLFHYFLASLMRAGHSFIKVDGHGCVIGSTGMSLHFNVLRSISSTLLNPLNLFTLLSQQTAALQRTSYQLIINAFADRKPQK